ncbi:hypothetical protein [Kibdelosporangium persicum]|uniref:hypothetical protein n=1 Tax=Kibdelosporangium persicum TaxID=2698649 RepID=UPI00156771C8|nr:hypothetical protein [Kibdelosporangium persicum]
MTDIQFETYGDNPESRAIALGEVESVYCELDQDASATFTWNDGGDDDVLIVAVGPGFAKASLLHSGEFYDLQVSTDDGLREVNICGQLSEHPVRFLMSRDKGLEVIKKAGDIPELFTSYTWVNH